MPGRTLTLTATLADGSTATTLTTVPALPATLSLAYNGKLRDSRGSGEYRAGQSTGRSDGTLAGDAASAAGGRTVTGLRLDSSAPGVVWDTSSRERAFWVLGVSRNARPERWL